MGASNGAGRRITRRLLLVEMLLVMAGTTYIDRSRCVGHGSDVSLRKMGGEKKEEDFNQREAGLKYLDHTYSSYPESRT